ncbi:hypothetical protein LCGC14_2969100, partial [marine sediment metagenome]
SLSRQAGEALQEGNRAQAAGLFGLSIQAIGVGVEAVIAFFLKESIKGFITGIGELFKAIFPFFSEQIDFGIQAAKDAIDFGIATLITTQSFAIAKAAQILGADVSTEFENIIRLMNQLFIGEDNSFKATFDAMTSAMINEVNPDLNNALGGFLSSLNSFISDIKSQAASFGGGGGGDGSGSAALRRATNNIFTQGIRTSLPVLIRISDEKLKENIKIIENPIEKLHGIKGVEWNWKEKTKQGNIGVIAQDVEKIFPDAVHEINGVKRVNYEALIGLLIEVVKDQQKQINDLK